MAGNANLTEQTLSDEVLSLNCHMKELAATGEWQQLMDFMTKRDAMLGQIESSGQEAVLLDARRSTEQILLLAEAAKQDVADRLATIKRGRTAADSYRATGSWALP